ncbi:hypothetical protein AGOR_G00114240 [Albula goreensis]|uniref:Uncharacterized protein n=1 Tax=Albula goreensis TaxID=1534307 RepID=A0A8T3DEW2_9TELE|nr:hypothetical protein AGOR_G00114240 [Albula goreensis]
MVRTSLLVSIALFLCGSTAKPHSTWDKGGDTQYQETLKSEELNGKMFLGIKEVEPPEDLAVTDDDIEPGMAIWNARKSRGKTHAVAEEDVDDLYHPSMERMLEAYDRPVRGRNSGRREVLGKDLQARPHRQAEPDMDGVYHAFPGPEVREPEQDGDDQYHRGMSDQGLHPQPKEQQKQPGGVVYTQPEEDRDDLYHGYIPDQRLHLQPQVQQEPRDHMGYTEPEEDKDALYHN